MLIFIKTVYKLVSISYCIKLMDCIFFVNPRAGAGMGKRLAEEIEQLTLPAPAFKQLVFTDPQRLQQQVFSCAQDKDLVVLCGGDGTVSSIIAHLVHLERIPTIAIIPIGTGNDIARGTKWMKSWSEFGLDGLFYAIKEGKVGSLDVWQMRIDKDGATKEYHFCAYAGIGYDGRVCQEFLKLNRFLYRWGISTGIKRLLYLPAGIRILYKNLLHPDRIRCEVTFEQAEGNRQYSDRLGQILFCNTGYYAGGSLLDRHYALDDGLLEFFGIKGYWGYMQMLFEGRLPVRHSSILPVRSSSYKLALFSSSYFQVDGEPMGVVERGSLIELELFRSVPLLKPFLDKYAKTRMKDAKRARAMKKLSSSVRPAVT